MQYMLSQTPCGVLFNIPLLLDMQCRKLYHRSEVQLLFTYHVKKWHKPDNLERNNPIKLLITWGTWPSKLVHFHFHAPAEPTLTLLLRKDTLVVEGKQKRGVINAGWGQNMLAASVMIVNITAGYVLHTVAVSLHYHLLTMLIFSWIVLLALPISLPLPCLFPIKCVCIHISENIKEAQSARGDRSPAGDWSCVCVTENLAAVWTAVYEMNRLWPPSLMSP